MTDLTARLAELKANAEFCVAHSCKPASTKCDWDYCEAESHRPDDAVVLALIAVAEQAAEMMRFNEHIVGCAYTIDRCNCDMGVEMKPLLDDLEAALK